MFFMAVSHGAPLVSGRETAADAMIQLAGGVNAIRDYAGNKPIGSEAIIAAAPELILLTELTLNAVGGLDEFYQLPGIAHTPAGLNRRVIVMDTLALLSFGPRSGQTALHLAERLQKPANVATTP
jgi:iron complex transport system substrate-binding protein